MSLPRSQGPKPPAEPDTESRRALHHWLEGDPAPRLAYLALASGIVEETLLAFVERHARPEPDSEAARLVAISTKGAVPSFGWWTEEEREASRGARARAARMANALEESPQSPRSHAPASRPMAVRRRCHRNEAAPRSVRPTSSATLPSTSLRREAAVEPRRLTLLLGSGAPPPSTERSDPPTQPSSPILPLSGQASARASTVAVVEPRAIEARPAGGRRRTSASRASITRGEMGVADAIETLTQQGYSIRLEKKDRSSQ